MKTRKTYRYMSFILLPLALFLVIGFFLHLNDYLFEPYKYINYLTLLLAAFIILSPWGNIRVNDPGDPGKRYPLVTWFCLILLLQLTLILIYVGLYTFTYHIFPVGSHQASLTPALRTLWQQWLIFPWGIIAMLAACLSFICYNQKQDAFISSAIEPIFKNKNDSLTTHVTQLCVRNSTIAGLATTFGIYIILIAVLMAQGDTKIIPHGLIPSAFILALFILVFVFLPFVKKGIARLLKRQVPTILGICATTIIGSLFLLLFSVLFSAAGLPSSDTQHPIYYKTLMSLGNQGIWLLFSANWWLSFTPICAIVIGYFSKGYTLRSILLATLIGPAVLALAPDFHYWMPAWLILTLLLGSFVIFFGLITKKNIRSMLVIGYIPKRGRYKARDFHFFFRRVFRFSGLIIYLYLPMGIMYIAMFLYIPGIMSLIVLALASVSFIVGIANRDIKREDSVELKP